MTYQAGVKTIVAGGQRKHGPMQAVGGTRGAAAYSVVALDYDFDDGLRYEPVDKPGLISQLPNRTDTGMWINYAGFTIRNQVRGTDFTPLQFQYQAADCRIYYTLETIYNATKLWSYTARAAWDDPSLCVQDSTGYPTARNKTSVKPPLSSRAAAPEIYDFPPLPSADNITFELLDATHSNKRSPGTITACNANSACNCLPMELEFSGKPKIVKACLPKCVLYHDQSKDCLGAGSYCDTTGVSQTKRNGFPTKGGLNYVSYDSYCKTKSPKFC